MDTVQLGTGSEDSGLCHMIKGLLEEAVARRGPLLSAGARIGIDTPDAAAQATLVVEGGARGRCVVEEGLNDPDLVLEVPSELLPQFGELPLRFGLPWLPSEAGRKLLMRALLGDVRLRGLRLFRAPRAAAELVLLLRLLAGASE